MKLGVIKDGSATCFLCWVNIPDADGNRLQKKFLDHLKCHRKILISIEESKGGKKTYLGPNYPDFQPLGAYGLH